MVFPVSLRVVRLAGKLLPKCSLGVTCQPRVSYFIGTHSSRRTFTTTSVVSSPSSSPGDHDFDESELGQNLTQDILLYNRKISPSVSKSVAVIMPRQKLGSEKKTKERGQFLLDETAILAENLKGWKVVGTSMVSTSNVHARGIFGKTNLEHLKEYIQMVEANAVVFALDILSPPQHHFLSDFLQIEVYDRFSVVLQIFRQRASTKEAKIQLALAELHYVKKNLHLWQEDGFPHHFDGLEHNPTGGMDRGGETYFQIHKNRIQERELRLKKMLEKIDMNTEQKKQQRLRQQIPSVAVVGYTNSGKTSLIKALTHDARLEPEDKLFATLDVSAHVAMLPSNLKVMLLDTIGFITEIPTTLVHSFKSSLSEIAAADLIVHLTDCSHPDMKLQAETVRNTLQDIGVPEKLLDTMIEVANKADKIDPEEQKLLLNMNHRLISATKRIGLDELMHSIEQEVMKSTDRFTFDIRVPNGGEQYQWLRREASIIESIPDEKDPNFIIMKVIVTKSKLGQFMKRFSKSNRA